MSIMETVYHAPNFLFLLFPWFLRVRFKAEERALGALDVLFEACQLRLYFALPATRAPSTDLGAWMSPRILLVLPSSLAPG